MNDINIAAALGQNLQAQAEYFRRNSYPSAAERRATLEKLLALVTNNREAICREISEDFGAQEAKDGESRDGERPGGRDPQQSQLLEIFPSQQSIKHSLKHLDKWMRPQSKGVSIYFKFGKAKVLTQPLGCAGIVVPWNYPLFLAIGPLVAALCAGNTAMVKMSEYTPAFGDLFARLIGESFSPEQVKVICGDAEVGNAFTQLPFDHILFTGSSRVGKIVMRNASENLTPVTLELGGKSPVIIDSDYSLHCAVDSILNGKILNAGQTCIAPDYVFVHSSQVDTFIARAKQAAQTFIPNGDFSTYTSIIHSSHYQRLEALVDDAKEKGAEIIPLVAAGNDSSLRKFSPVIAVKVNDDMRLMDEEIFGPILPVLAYDNIDDVLAKINHGPRPLALYLYSNDKKLHDKVLAQSHSGGVTINDMMLHVVQENLPFGGVGNSGMGHYHGEAGYRTFSKEKSIFIQSRFNGSAFIRLPFTGITKKIIKFMVNR